MSAHLENQYQPDCVSPPGETLREAIEAHGTPLHEFATRLGIPPDALTKLLRGDAPLQPDTALVLEKVLNVPGRFWINLETQYQEHLARKNDAGKLEGRA